MVKRVGLVLIFYFFTLTLYSQNENLVQFTGRVFNEFIQPLAFTNIVITNQGRGTISDKSGKFSFVVQQNDTVLFSSIGYKKAIVIIPDTLKSKFLTRDVLLESDTIMIAAVEVYPWKDYEEFKEAFLNLELPDDDLDRARKNIALIQEQLDMQRVAMPMNNYRYTMEQHTWKAFNRGTTPTYQIFNLMAWSKFFEALKNGDFKNDKK